MSVLLLALLQRQLLFAKFHSWKTMEARSVSFPNALQQQLRQLENSTVYFFAACKSVLAATVGEFPVSVRSCVLGKIKQQ